MFALSYDVSLSMPNDIQQTIARNADRIREHIASAADRAGRSAVDITVVAVSKYVGMKEIQALYDLGFRHFGENRVDAAKAKIDHFADSGITWHMIGNIQRRKLPKILGDYQRLDAVDRMSVAEEIEKRADHDVEILIEVNVSGEESKHGFKEDELAEAVAKMGEMPRVKPQGLMTMAPYADDPETTRPVFKKLRELVDQFGFPVCSMGMTNDFEQAIEEGATEVRIGSAFFEGLSPE